MVVHCYAPLLLSCTTLLITFCTHIEDRLFRESVVVFDDVPSLFFFLLGLFLLLSRPLFFSRPRSRSLASSLSHFLFFSPPFFLSFSFRRRKRAIKKEVTTPTKVKISLSLSFEFVDSPVRLPDCLSLPASDFNCPTPASGSH